MREAASMSRRAAVLALLGVAAAPAGAQVQVGSA